VDFNLAPYLSSAVVEDLGFLGSFAMLGAVGFRFALLRPTLARAAPVSERATALRRAESTAAWIGGVGVVLSVASIAAGLAERAEAKHLSLTEAAAAGGAVMVLQSLFLLALAVAFTRAARRNPSAWMVALVAAIGFALRGAARGKLSAMVNPLHVLGASLWLGTLFVLVVAGLRTMLDATVPSSDREESVAEMVRRFSPLALSSAGLLGLTGLITALTHVKSWDALFSTLYGLLLCLKLAVVALVALLGAWNWRKVGPSLGREGGAQLIRGTASAELGLATVVLLITGFLVSVPSH
jgi:putative copper export protein